MKNSLLYGIAIVFLLSLPGRNFGQAPNLGTATEFVLFTSVGAVTNTGISHLTGHVGTNSGSSTGFGNVNGVMHDNDLASAQCNMDLITALIQLNAAIPTFFPAPLLGNGQILYAGIYSIPSPSTLNLDLTLDAQGDPGAIFIIKINGTFGAAAASEVILANGAQACNVFWHVQGAVSLAAGTKMRGTIVAENSAIDMSTGVELEGRALSNGGAITLSGTLAYTPIGCGSPVLTGPMAPDLSSANCFAIFSSDGPVTNTGITTVVGDVGTNVGLTTGFDPLLVTGAIHPIPDGVTAQAAADLLNAYAYLNTLPHDIELLYPAQFGNNLVLTPHTYRMNGAVTFTDTLFLNGGGVANAVFVIKIYGALSTSTYSRVVLMNGTEAENVYWLVSGAVDINDYSIFKGTIVCNNGAINLMTGVDIEGRALTTTGAVSVSAINIEMPPGCGGPASPPLITSEPSDQTVCEGSPAIFTVIAAGDGLTYQWRKGNVDLIDGGNISGALTDSLIIDPTSLSDMDTDYHVIVSGTTGPNDTSDFVSLTVHTAPIITSQPVNQVVGLGGSAVFAVTATGDSLIYQWYKGLVMLVDGGNVTGTTSATLIIDPVTLVDVATNYNVVVTGICSPAVTSLDASLIISASPVIATQPSDQTVCEGSSASFTVIATGDGLTYQWRIGTVALVNGGNISGATSATLTIDPTSISDMDTAYNVVVSGTYAPNDTSDYVSLTVHTAPFITSQPITQFASVGGSAVFSITATGDSLTYQWYKGLVILIDGGNISGATSANLSIDPVTAMDAGSDYSVTVSGICPPSATLTGMTLVISASPIIVTQPSDQTVCEGSSASFTVIATGDGLTYQWRKGTVALMNGGNISGATSATLVINPVLLTDAAADYNVVVSGTYAPSVTSNDVSLFVNTAPSITSQPINQIVNLGATASFSVFATGDGLTYQWRKGSVNLINGVNISGATSATLVINAVTPADEATDYNVVVSGTCSPAVPSLNASLAISTPPNIFIQPANQTACEGGSASFTVIATGDGLTYQWRKGTVALVNGANISGANSAILVINPVALSDAATNYNVVVSGTYPPSVTSNDVSLIVIMAPSITTQPVNQVVNQGATASFSVVAVGDGLTYQWRKGTVNLINGGNISGATSPTLVINSVTPADVATNYNVVVSGTCSPAVTSVNVSLVISTPPSIVTQPANQTVCAGGSASFTVVATGDGLTYQWRKGTVALVNGGNISGATSATLVINPVALSDAATNYNVVVSGTYTPSVTSNNVSLVVNIAPSITSQPVNQVVNVGTIASFSVVAVGDGLTYQWRKGTVNLINGGNISGATSPTLVINSVTPADVATNYNVVVSGTCSPAVTSVNVSLVISTPPSIVTQPANQTVCAGGSASFTVMALGDGLTYQWRKGAVPLVNGGNISGANTATLVINPVALSDAATDYNVIVSGTYPPAVTSVNVSLTVNTAPIIVNSPTNLTVCEGDQASFTVIATGTGLTYQWRRGLINLTNGGNISGATTATLTINPVLLADAGTNYNVVISGTCAPAATSVDVSLIVNTAPVLTTSPANQTVCEGASVSFSVTATGTALTYQWRLGTVNLSNGGNISGATTSVLTINPVDVSDAANNYNVVVSGSCSPAAISANATLVVNTSPVITSGPANQTVCEGNSASFSVTATGTALTYQWRKGTVNLTNGGNISGATTSTLTINPVTTADAATNYNVVITGTCSPGVTSANAFLAINVAPVIATEPVSQTVCEGENVSFSVIATGSAITYQWRKGTVNLSNGGNISGATSATLNISSVSLSDAATDYNVVVSGVCSPPAISSLVILSVTPLPQAIPLSNSPVCIGRPINLLAQTVQGGAYEWWGPDNFSSTDQNPVILSALEINAGDYVLIVSANGCFSAPAMVNVTVLDCGLYIPEGFSPNADGINDLFVIRGILYYPKNKINIYNRWGEKVYEASPYQNQWDGNSELGLQIGEGGLPVGTYFYILDPGDGTDVYKGYIYLNR
jgi:gliding motility-associated-like protein